MKSLSDRTQNIAASLTVAIDTMAKQMIADGKDVVSLGAGEPDFGTPTPIQDAAIEAIRAGKTRYTAPVGILDVRKAVAKKLEEDPRLRAAGGGAQLRTGLRTGSGEQRSPYDRGIGRPVHRGQQRDAL